MESRVPVPFLFETLDEPVTSVVSRERGAPVNETAWSVAGSTFCKVAIITRTKDRPLLLRRAIESVLRQTFSNWTHIMINDGGHPALCAMAAAEFRDRYAGRLVLINNDRSAGMQCASNSAIASSASDYIVIHDDDDSWDERFLAETVKFLESEEGTAYGGVITHTVQIKEIMTSDGPVETSRNEFNCDLKNINLFRMMGGNLFPPISFLYRRQVHESVGYFDQAYDVLGDWDFNLRMLQKFEIAVLPKKLAFYHWRPKTEAPAYANTVTAGVDRHHAILNKIQNAALRAETDFTGFGSGAVSSISRSLSALEERLSRLEAGLWELNNVGESFARKIAANIDMGPYIGIVAIRSRPHFELSGRTTTLYRGQGQGACARRRSDCGASGRLRNHLVRHLRHRDPPPHATTQGRL